VVEDDPYGALYFDDVTDNTATRPIKADDRDGQVVYLSSFSKTVAPGFRVAWIAAPAPLTERFEIAKQSADLCSGGLDQRMTFEAWRRGILSARLPLLRATYQHKRVVMERALRRELGDLVAWPAPKGGFFLWLTLPVGIDTDGLLREAIARGVVFVPGSAFFVNGLGVRHARLSFSWPKADRIELGIRRLAETVRDAMGSAPSAASGGRSSSAADRPVT
jgi:2-aminoadipate transaminase